MKPISMRLVAAALFAGAIILALPLRAADKIDTSKLPLPAPRKVDFAKEIYPIFDEKCISCHGPKKQKGKYRMDTGEFALKPGKDGPLIIPGNSEKSPLVHGIAGLIDDGLMPPPSDKPGESVPLTKEQIGLIRAWIDQGAIWPAGSITVAAKELTFANDIGPVLKTACAECHGEAKQAGDFRADSLAAVLKGGKTYGKSVTPGNLKSPLVIIASGLDEDLPLPEKHKLPANQVDLIKKWVEQGAK